MVKVGVKVSGQGKGHDRWSQGLGSRSVVKVRGQGRGVKVRVIIGDHKVGGQGRWSRSGYRSWDQVGRGLGSRSGVKVVVKIGGQGQESRLLSR